MGGSVGAQAVGYEANGIAPRRDPFYWVVSANLNITLLNKISVPFSAVITQQDKQYTSGIDKFSQPFNQFGISPRYKWLTLHAGHRSVEFSEYSLSGAMFLGGGAEIKPENSIWSGAAIYGRFVKAVPQGGVNGVIVSLPAYERMGGAAKIRAGTDKNFGELIFMKLKDDIYSIPLDTSLNVLPQENQVIALSSKQSIGEKITLSGDFSYSMLTKNLMLPVTKIERFTYINQIYDPRMSSQYNKAFNLAADVTPGKWKYGVRYKRIDPDYRSLGAIFLTNDVEELSGNASVQLFDNKLSVSGAGGVQKNNLDKIQAVGTNKLIGSANFNLNLNEHLGFTANYSNFSSNTIPVRDVLNDSLKFVQLTSNGGLGFNYNVQKSTVQHNITNNLQVQRSENTQQPTNTFFNETLVYSLNFSNIGLAINVSGIYNNSISELSGEIEGVGPNLGIQKVFFKNRVRCQTNAGYQNNYQSRILIDKNYFASASFSFIVDKHQTINVNCNIVQRKSLRVKGVEFDEKRISIAYQFIFSARKKTTINSGT